MFLPLVAVNVLSTLPSKPLGGTNASVSALYPTPVTPAGYAFIIWTPIYFALGMTCVRQWFVPLSAAATSSLILAQACNCVWLLLFNQRQIEAALAVSLLYLATYILLHRLIGMSSREPAEDIWAYLANDLGTSLHLGWLTFAQAANFAVNFTASSGFMEAIGLEPAAWGLVLAALLFLSALLMLVVYADSVFAGTIAWALIAVYVKQSTDVAAPGYGTALPDTAATLGISAGAMSLLVSGVWAVVAFRRIAATGSAFDPHHVPGPSLVALVNKSLGREPAFDEFHVEEDDSLLSPTGMRVVM